MKTAMQELIGLIVNNKIRLDIIEKNQQMWLEKEKEQIIDFAYKILETSDNHQSGYCNVEEIYNQTYNQNK